jgi:hypothetical protein
VVDIDGSFDDRVLATRGVSEAGGSGSDLPLAGQPGDDLGSDFVGVVGVERGFGAVLDEDVLEVLDDSLADRSGSEPGQDVDGRAPGGCQSG